jgi:hypothetical protein
MTFGSPALSRRTALGAALAAAPLPRSGFGQQGGGPASQEATDVRIRMTFGGRTLIATLYDNLSARDFASMLPLDLTIEDYSNSEKIAYSRASSPRTAAAPSAASNPATFATASPRATWPSSRPTTATGPWTTAAPSRCCCGFDRNGRRLAWRAPTTPSPSARLGRTDPGFDLLDIPGAVEATVEPIE